MNKLTVTMTDEQYVECMIFAGWIDAAALDRDYQDYVKRVHQSGLRQGDELSYEEWQRSIAEWDDLSDRFNILQSELGFVVAYETIDGASILKQMERLEWELAL